MIQKNIFLLVLGVTLWLASANYATLSAQSYAFGTDSANVFRMPVGYTQIGDEGYFGLRLQPEFAIGKFGIGIDVPIFFSTEGNGFRDEEYKRGSGIFRLIRYLRYGVKERDPFYVKMGDITGSYMGYGILMNNYTNSPSFERREVGITFDIRLFKLFGLEMTHSKFSGPALTAIRPYVRPLAKTDLPILNTLEVGFSYITDRDDRFYNAGGAEQPTVFVQDGANGWGADLGVTVVNTEVINLVGYMQYAKHGTNDALRDSLNRALLDPTFTASASDAQRNGYEGGGGFSIGARARFNLGDNLNLEATLERLWYQEHFLPQFFDAVYEIDKDAKLWLLTNAEQISGTYGRVSANILDKVTISGGLQIPDQVTDQTPAMLHLGLQADDLIPKVLISGSYYKGNLGNLADAFTFDDRSLAQARVGYRVKDWLVVGMDYRWTFAKISNDDGTESFEARNYVMPYFGLDIPLGKKEE